jgi:hypothetical protein
MVYPPGQTLTIRDGGIGLLSTQTALPLVVGVSSSGTADTLYQFTDPNELKDDLGHGPGVELALPVMREAGGCLFLKCTAGSAGSNGAVTVTRIGTSTGTITVAVGAPRDSYRVLVEITFTGTVGAGKFRYSLDRYAAGAAYTWSEEITIPAGGVFAVPNAGFSITFVPGAGAVFFQDGDLFSFDSTAPHYTTTNLGTAMTALLATIGSRKIRKVFFSGRNATSSAGATMAAAIATHMATLESLGYYGRALMDMGTDAAATAKTSFASFANARVAPVYGDAAVTTMNSFAGWGTPRYPALIPVATRAAGADLSENLGRKASGSLVGVVAIYNDEGTNTSFSEADKIITLRTYRGENGFYITNGYLRSPSGSDFLYWDWGCTMDEICETISEAERKWLLKKLRVVADGTGHLDSRDAARVESAVRAALKSKLLDPTNIEGYKGHVSAVSYSVDQTNDFLATRTLISAAAAVPLPPAETIESQVGFARSVS